MSKREAASEKQEPPRNPTPDSTEVGSASASASTGLRGVGDEAFRRLAGNFHELVERGEIFYPVQFRFARELGRGRQGIVFLALRHGARGCVTRHAIKVYDPQIYPDAEAYWTDMGRIASQTSVLQTIQSPNLVSRDTYDEVNGIGYTQMEVIHGIDVDQFLTGAHLDRARQRFPVKDWARLHDVLFRVNEDQLRIQPGIAIYIMRMALRGLESLHEKGFVHGDIKPSNIMLDRVGTVKLIDYGRAARAAERIPVLFGSPLYMAPEVHRRTSILVQSDIYSVGLLGLVLLAGKKTVFSRVMSESDLLEFKLALPALLPEILPPYVVENRKFLDVLRQFIAPEPKDRFPDALTAESDAQGLRMVHKQLTLSGKDSDYGRDVSAFINAVNLEFWDSITLRL